MAKDKTTADRTTKEYIAIDPIRHSGMDYLAGDAIALTDADASALMSAGAIANTLPALNVDPE